MMNVEVYLSWACRHSFDIRYSVFMIRYSMVLRGLTYRRCVLPLCEAYDYVELSVFMLVLPGIYVDLSVIYCT